MQFIEPCKAANWAFSDVQLFLTQYTASARALDAFKQQAVWERYMGTLRCCLLKMYHN
ncbi:hypothetical protein AB205_0127100 [Aquarana catesbeiana]|uniref:Uncharacterized protein n=1 Tax=Aquarana catesbeiana TaxID=8400 RepID=A0A2G9S7J3_AQUCT|nr:hypothetical protein AB205_0127100 [Aquarana catesbeiana]